jgi:hypothetical protein
MKQTKRYISITKKSDTSITVIYHAMSLTVLYIMAGTSYMSVISDNVCFVLDQHAQLDFFSARTLKLKPVHMILILSQTKACTHDPDSEPNESLYTLS